MFEHLVGQLFKRSERAHAEQFHASGKSIDEKVRLYAQVGQALIEAFQRRRCICRYRGRVAMVQV